MYPSSSSSSSQQSMASGGGGGGGLTRYGSAPSSLLTSAVDSIMARGGGGAVERDFSPLGSNYSMAGHFFSGECSALNPPESTPKLVNNSSNNASGGSGLQRSYGFSNGDFGNSKLGETSSSSSLVRQRSSPAGFFSHLATESPGGFSVTRGPGVSRLNPRLSFTRQDSLSQMSQVSENVLDGVSSENGHQKATHSYANATFGIDSWDNANSIVFSAPPSKRAKNMDGDFLNFSSLESQFSLPQTSLEMATVEKLLQIPEDSVPCKIRAKRGCATHPRSIAERERRTRISGKLKKLQDLVPNMDKQTSYSDMLDLAVQHIKGLQNQVQNLHKDLEDCTCGCKESTE